MSWFKKKARIKILVQDITEKAILSLGYNMIIGPGLSGTIAIDESGKSHFSHIGDSIGYILNPNTMTYRVVVNEYIWNNL